MMTTAPQIIARAQREQPQLKLAVSADGSAIGAWSESAGRYVMVAGRILSNPAIEDWRDLPYELLIDGKAPVDDWVPVD